MNWLERWFYCTVDIELDWRIWMVGFGWRNGEAAFVLGPIVFHCTQE